MSSEPQRQELYAAIDTALSEGGTAAAVESLIEQLTATRDYQALFYAMLLRARVNLGVSPFATGPASELPAAVHADYEEAIRTSARHVGNLYLKERNIARAWGYYRMLDEPEPVREAIARFVPTEADDLYGVVEVAWQQGVYPECGFDLILKHQGICSAITVLSGTDLTGKVDLRNACVSKLVVALHAQLLERLQPTEATVRSMAESFLELPSRLEEHEYHIDVSHLNSVVQMAMQLPANHGMLPQAIELSRYGERLAKVYIGDAQPPFEHGYVDFTAYLQALAGVDTEAQLAVFGQKAAMGAATGETFQAEVLVNLCVAIGKPDRALAIAKQYLTDLSTERSCPADAELARLAGNLPAMAFASRATDDVVNYLAAKIASLSPPV